MIKTQSQDDKDTLTKIHMEVTRATGVRVYRGRDEKASEIPKGIFF